MPLEPHAAIRMSSPLSETTLVVLVLVSFIYLRGWRGVRGGGLAPFTRGARLVSFRNVLGLGSAGLATRGLRPELLTVHMIQHLLLMTVAPVLLLLGEPYWLSGMDCHDLEKVTLGPLLQRPLYNGLRGCSLGQLCAGLFLR